MGIKTVKDIKELVVVLLSSLFKKKLNGEYYTNNVRSIFYFNDYVQEERILDKSEEHLILRKSQVQHIENSKLIFVQSKFNQNIADVSIEQSVQKLKLPGEDKPLELSDKDIKPMISCDVKELKNTDTAKQPRKLNDNPHFLKIKQELESQLKNSPKFSGKSDALLSDKNKEQKQACGEDVLLPSSEDLPVEPEVKQEPVVSNDSSPSIPPPPPIEGLANFKGPKLPLSLPMQEQKQEQPYNVSQSKISIRPNLNSALIDELVLKLEKRKDKAHSV